MGADNELAEAAARERALEGACSDLKRYRAELRERLKRCVLRRRAKRIGRMAYLARLGREKGTFSPGRMARDTGIGYSTVYADMRLLLRLGILQRLGWGRYKVKDGLGRGLEGEIAGRLAALEVKEAVG
jgi:hypothetical protein